MGRATDPRDLRSPDATKLEFGYLLRNGPPAPFGPLGQKINSPEDKPHQVSDCPSNIVEKFAPFRILKEFQIVKSETGAKNPHDSNTRMNTEQTEEETSKPKRHKHLKRKRLRIKPNP